MQVSEIFWTLAAIVLGPFVGSFIGLLTLRLPAERPWAAGRSACDGCGRKLSPLDLIPILSFAALRGRCRSCGAAIPRRYLLLELACLGIGAWSATSFIGPMALATAVLGWWLLLLATIDAEHFWLPDMLTLPLGVVGFAVSILVLREPVWTPVLGAAVGFGSLWLLAFAYKRLRGREGLGGGDPRLLGAIGAWTGWSALPSVVVWAGLAGISVALAQLVLRRRVTMDQRLPFGVFLAIGAWLTWLLGPLHGLFG
ncbi:prepilin peptidase [Caulobacter endophyticus]|uniref:Prepilin leader peptidase/N-methyltransferase n=1 Tax=Caulobacter endophyticus TaxID=2172652 RepID=A0A2T9JF33_9CAUL|nr:A24 family peptidase [Caulobacter endophyticus]PVM82276.1 prepilin peptidase [Caulobacter endophyticus]